MANLPGQPDPAARVSSLRAADCDRDRVAEVLRQAAGDGRLTLDELDERLGQVYAARTYAELEPLTRDLPKADHLGHAAASVTAGRIGGQPTSRLAVALMSGFRRAGSWVVPRRFTAVALMGGGGLDLREAHFAEPEVTIAAIAVMGGIEIIVPQDAELVVHGIGVMGGINSPRAQPGHPGAPRIVVRGFALMGGIDVKRRAPRADKGGSQLLPRDEEDSRQLPPGDDEDGSQRPAP
jgi:Domain of unknown function (DUF1707)